MNKLKDCAAEWKEIGCHLGFRPGQLEIIESKPLLLPTAPVSYFGELLTQWLHRGDATLQALKSALNQTGLRVLSNEIIVPS